MFLNLRAQHANTLEERNNILYRLTNDLRKRLNGKPLGAHLADELSRFSEPARIRHELMGIVSSLAGNELSYAQCYKWLNGYLQETIVLNGAAGDVLVIKGESVCEIIKRFPISEVAK